MSIYVLRSDNLVKIGFSENLRNRVQAIIATVPVPVEFVGHMPGGRDFEAHLHEIFAESRFSGEWFVESDKMRSLFETLLIARLPRPQTRAEIRKTSEKKATADVSRRVREEAAARWPGLSKAGVIDALAHDLGWSRTRAKDFFYADPKMALRAFEMEEIDKWLALENEVSA